MRVIEHQFSELLRHPNAVTDDLEDGDVLLRRRDEPDLRLSRADRETERTAVFATLGRTLRSVAVHNPALLEAALAEEFPWVEFLPAKDRKEFLGEFSRVVAATTEVDAHQPLTQLLREWRATAEVYADPRLAKRLGGSLSPSGDPVTRPAD